MTRFKDTYISDCIPGYPCASVPRWNARIAQVDSGAEQANSRWENPLFTFMLPRGVREHDQFNAIYTHWMVMNGPAHTFPFRDPLDCASVETTVPVTDDDLLPAVSDTDQAIGTGDGVTRVFQLQKEYSVSGYTYIRPIYKPVVSSVVVALNGAPQASGFSVSRITGQVTFTSPPGPGVAITAGFYFDNEVRFESNDSFEGIVQTYANSGFAPLTFIEVHPCNDEEN